MSKKLLLSWSETLGGEEGEEGEERRVRRGG